MTRPLPILNANWGGAERHNRNLALVEKRAEELAARARERYIEEMWAELRAGTLSAMDVRFWEPKTATKVKQLLDRVRGELDLVRGAVGILIP